MIQERLAQIQRELKAPKNQLNKFGGYKYRSCEDILEAAKPLLGEAILTLSDEIILIGNRYYVQAIARLMLGEETVVVSAYAREEEVKKGMDASQITGAASSYARKYALNGLFLIDDTKDADTQDNTGDTKPAKQAKESKPEPVSGGVEKPPSTLDYKKLLTRMMNDRGVTDKEQQKAFYAFVMDGKDEDFLPTFIREFDDALMAFTAREKEEKESE